MVVSGILNKFAHKLLMKFSVWETILFSMVFPNDKTMAFTKDSWIKSDSVSANSSQIIPIMAFVTGSFTSNSSSSSVKT